MDELIDGWNGWNGWNGWTDDRIGGCMDGWMDEWMVGRMDEWMDVDGRMNGRTGWMDGCAGVL